MRKQTDLRPSDTIRKAIDAALRRHRIVILAAEAPVALAIALCGLLFIALLGTTLLPPASLILFAAAALTFALVRLRKHALSRYSVAQVADTRLHFSDALSTAYFLLSSERPLTPAGIFQIETTATITGNFSAREAFPFERPRAWWIVLALLAAVAISTLMRYAALGSLDLRPPVLPIAAIAPIKPGARELTRRDAPKPNRLRIPAVPAMDPLTAAADHATQSKQANGAGDPADAIRNLEQQLQAQQNSDAHESLLTKAADAMRGLASELKQAAMRNNSEPPRRNGAQQAAPSDAAVQNSSKPRTGDRTGAQNDGQGEQHEAAKAEARAIENHTGNPLGQSDQAAQEKGRDAQSGAGRDEGQKTIQNAEELKAVGRLEQIIGKRSASITGDMHLAKSSRDQQLRTQYSNRIGQHSESGGEIHHDQIPPEYRDYIRAYMDAVHNAAAHGH